MADPYSRAYLQLGFPCQEDVSHVLRTLGALRFGALQIDGRGPLRYAFRAVDEEQHGVVGQDNPVEATLCHPATHPPVYLLRLRQHARCSLSGQRARLPTLWTWKSLNVRTHFLFW